VYFIIFPECEMQTRKDEIRDCILNAARLEFERNGFERASIRNITAAAGTSKSNVYNYFPDKDALFAAVVEPTLAGIQQGVENLKARNPQSTAAGYSMAAQQQVITAIMQFVEAHKIDLKLLLFSSSGSSQAGFREEIIESLTDLLADWVAHAAPNRDISRLFIQMVAGFYITSIEQLLSQDIPLERSAGQMQVFLKFIYGGWNAVLNKK
jgi:TetR/AcrR family transcriptional regulator, cholesterol catabolism regulator